MEENTRPKKRTYVLIIIAVLLVILAFAAFIYYFQAQKHAGRFPEGTYINGIDVSDLNVSRAKQKIADQTESYTLTITGRDGQETVLTGEQLGLAYVDDGAVEELLSQYSPYRWFFDERTVDELTISAISSYDREKVKELVEALPMFQKFTPAADAYVDVQAGHYVVVPEVQGNELLVEKTVEAILDAIDSRESSLILTDEYYKEPSVRADDTALNQQVEQLNKYLDIRITYDFGDGRIVTVDGKTILDLVAEDESGAMEINRDKVYEFVKEKMAYQYDTFGLKRTFVTHSGEAITLSGGDYGWCLDRDQTTDELIAAIEEGYSGEMSPKWKYSAKNLGEDDMGGSYVEVSISEQMMWCYKNGRLVVETPVVTGNVTKGNGTPYGSVWAIDGMKRDATLGTIDTMGYSSPVKYWMPFTGNVGIHDADGWRSEYGGDIYLNRGSHGCVNTPEEACSVIFNNVEIGTAVVVYDLTDLNANGTPDDQEEEEAPPFEITDDDDWDWDD